MMELSDKYDYAVVNKVNHLNCQGFCFHMLAYAKDISFDAASALLIGVMGTWIY